MRGDCIKVQQPDTSAMWSLFSATIGSESCDMASVSHSRLDNNDDEDSLDDGDEFFGPVSASDSMANRAMRQLRLLLSAALQERHRDRAIGQCVRAGFAASFGLLVEDHSAGLAVHQSGPGGMLPTDRSTELGTITALDALTQTLKSTTASSSICEALLARRLRDVLFTKRCARLLTDCHLADLLRVRIKAVALLLPLQAPVLPLATCNPPLRSDGSTVCSSAALPLMRLPSLLLQRRRRCSSSSRQLSRCHRREQQRSDHRRLSRSTSSRLSSSLSASQEHCPQFKLEIVMPMAGALNTEGSNSNWQKRPQQQLMIQKTQPTVARCPTGLVHVGATHTCGQRESNQHHLQQPYQHLEAKRHRRRRLQHETERKPKPKAKREPKPEPQPEPEPKQEKPQQPSVPALPDPLVPPAAAAALRQRLCPLHSTPAGFRKSSIPAASSQSSPSCPVCASRHFLLRHLAQVVAIVDQRSGSQLIELERTLCDCLDQQRRWHRSLKWIASNVKEHRLPGSVRSLVSSCCCSEDRS